MLNFRYFEFQNGKSSKNFLNIIQHLINNLSQRLLILIHCMC